MLGEADEQVPAEEEYVEGGGEREREKFGEFLQIAHGCEDWSCLINFKSDKECIEPVRRKE